MPALALPVGPARWAILIALLEQGSRLVRSGNEWSELRRVAEECGRDRSAGWELAQCQAELATQPRCAAPGSAEPDTDQRYLVGLQVIAGSAHLAAFLWKFVCRCRHGAGARPAPRRRGGGVVA